MPGFDNFKLLHILILEGLRPKIILKEKIMKYLVIFLTIITFSCVKKENEKSALPKTGNDVNITMKLKDIERKKLFEIWDQVYDRYLQEDWNNLTEAEQNFYAVWHFESEVNSGGFESYYFNSGGDHALYAPKALRIIGAPKLAQIIDKANKIFPKGPPSQDIDDRQEIMDNYGDDIYSLWEHLDQKIFTREEPTEFLLWQYYQKNKTHFK